LKYYLPLIFPIITLIAVIATSEITVQGKPIIDEPDYETPECFGDECYRDTPTADELNSIMFDDH